MIKIHKITSNDDDRIAEIVRVNLKSYGLDVPGTVYFDPELDCLSKYYNEKPEKRVYLIAEDEDGDIIGGAGIAELNGMDNCAEIQKLYLVDKAKGKGLGWKLLKMAEKSAADLGYSRSYLETHSSLSAAVELYKNAGYVQIDKPDFVVHTTMNMFFVKDILEYIELESGDKAGIAEMSQMATAIVREHFDPLIGKEQNDYMLDMFQTESAINKQLEDGYRYFFVRNECRDLGFIAFYPKQDTMYLSKFYLYKAERGKGHACKMLDFVIENAKKAGLHSIELNVNKNNSACRVYESLGFKIVRSEKNDIGNGFYMDDHVYRLEF